MTEKFADVNGIKICYEIHGDGYPLILVHGYGAVKENWMCQIEALSEKCKVIIFDNRGAGKSDRPNFPYTMDIYADDIKALMDYLKIDKAHIGGWSLGGMIVQNFVLKYPERVNTLILINTFPGFPNEQGLIMYKNSQINKYNEILEDPIKAFFNHAVGFTRKFRKMMMADPKRKFHGLFCAEDIIKMLSTNPMTPQDLENAANAIAHHEVTDRLNEIRHPTLLISGDKDRLSPKIAMEKIHENLPNSILKVVQDVGHDAPFEKAPEVNKIILEFLDNY